MTYRELLALPRDPATLYRRFHDAAVECECGNSVDQETFVLVATSFAMRRCPQICVRPCCARRRSSRVSG